MFEQLVPDKGNEGLERAARIFYVVTGFAVLALALRLLLLFSTSAERSDFVLFQLAISGVLAFTTARGIEEQRPWAKWLGYAQGFLTMFNVPIGTVIGIAILVYLNRADKAGLFKQGPAGA
jgi:hypothetical protein